MTALLPCLFLFFALFFGDEEEVACAVELEEAVELEDVAAALELELERG